MKASIMFAICFSIGYIICFFTTIFSVLAFSSAGKGKAIALTIIMHMVVMTGILIIALFGGFIVGF